MYIGLSTLSSIKPLLTLTNSTKSVSVVVVRVYLLKTKLNLSLSAPAAFSFVVPCELSNKLESSEEDIKFSVTVIPTLYEGAPEYFSKISSCAGTFTKNPLIKRTPSEIFAIEPLPVGFELTVNASTVNSLLFDELTEIAPFSSTVTSCSSSPAEKVNELLELVPCD